MTALQSRKIVPRSATQSKIVILKIVVWLELKIKRFIAIKYKTLIKSSNVSPGINFSDSEPGASAVNYAIANCKAD